ncbi:heterokaryon incompatibility protein-domain-containing protein [Nemania abortiva]|nr:heterokaryon incompatibility protein-domain-containing protein [Nemania abortiva]
MTTKAAYEYKAIAAPRTIRLMHLQPGTETDPIHLSLVTTTLDSAPDFEAISYCWGSSQEERQVTCNGATLHITNSLFTGLIHFRHADRPRILWADAICINQADTVEKSGQVQLMPHTYSQSTRTLVWLGVANDPTFGSISPSVAALIHGALELLPEFDPENSVEMATTAQTLYHDSRRLRDEGKPNLIDHDWEPLAQLLSRPWFFRKWVVQEVVLAKEVVLYAGGGVEVPWPNLAKLAFSMEGMGVQTLLNLEGKEMLLRSAIRPLHCVTNILMVQVYRHSGTLVDGVMNTIDFGCTDSRDHVYSLLSLGAIGPTILPDYSASISEVFIRFAIAMIVEGQSLKLLSLAPDRATFWRSDTERLEGLPSWVPDLQRIETDVITGYTVRPQAFFAGGRTKPILSVTEDQRVLRCQGRVIDTVKTFESSLIEMTIADVPEQKGFRENIMDPSRERRRKRLVRWLEACYHAAFGYEISSKMAKPSEELMMSFSRTMLCDMDLMRNRLPPHFIAAFPQYMQWVAERAAIKPSEDGQQPTVSMRNYSSVIDESIGGFASLLKFCITGQGRFGQIPSKSQPGDCICVLVGGEVPFVVRPTGRGTYTFVGECYIDGIMDGETFSGDHVGAQLPETIHFE